MMNMHNTHITNQAHQITFDSFGLLLADLWLTICGARLLCHHAQLAYAPRGYTKTQPICERLQAIGICKMSIHYHTQYNNFLNTNIILFSHSFGGLSPPKNALG